MVRRILLITMAGILAFGSLTFASVEDESAVPVDFQARHEKNLMRMTQVFETYYPERVDAFLALDAEHTNFHEEQKSEREAMMAQGRAIFDAIRQSVQDGTLTREEGKVELDAIKAGHEADQAQVKAILEMKKAELEAAKSDNEAARETLRILLSSEEKDVEAIQAALDQIMILLQNHISIDEKYAGLIDGVIL